MLVYNMAYTILLFGGMSDTRKKKLYCLWRTNNLQQIEEGEWLVPLCRQCRFDCINKKLHTLSGNPRAMRSVARALENLRLEQRVKASTL